MSLESATVISQLQISNPSNADPVSQGDDHLRLIKAVLQSQFPGAGGGFSVPITAKEAEINYLSGVTSNIQAQITANTTAVTKAQSTADQALALANNNSNAIFPAGTIMSFYQPFIVAGWSLMAPSNRISISTAVLSQAGVEGGIHSPLTNPYVASHNHGVGGVAVSNETVNHVHQYTMPTTTSLVPPGSAGQVSAITGTTVSNTVPESVPHQHLLSGATDVNSGTTWQPMYAFCIICKKN